MKKIISLTLLCLLCGTAVIAQTLEISIRKHGSVAVLTLDGELTAENATLFNNKFKEALNTIGGKVVVNMEKVDMIDDTGLSVLVFQNRQVSNVGGKMAICHLQPIVKSIFEMSALDKLFNIYENEVEAIQSLY